MLLRAPGSAETGCTSESDFSSSWTSPVPNNDQILPFCEYLKSRIISVKSKCWKLSKILQFCFDVRMSDKRLISLEYEKGEYGVRTRDPFITSEVLYHWANPPLNICSNSDVDYEGKTIKIAPGCAFQFFKWNFVQSWKNFHSYGANNFCWISSKCYYCQICVIYGDRLESLYARSWRIFKRVNQLSVSLTKEIKLKFIYLLSELKGDTGPLVYPGGFVYLYSVLYHFTDKGTDLDLAQQIFALLYLIQLGKFH